MTARPADLLGRGWWTLQRFGLTPSKLTARLGNRTEPRILCVSLPKAGTHLLERALCLHPQLYRKLLPTVRGLNVDRWNGVEGILDRLRPGQIVMAHLPYEPSLPDLLAAKGVSALFLIRDPHDIVVSEAFYLSSNRKHRLHGVVAERPSLRERIKMVVEGDAEAGIISIGRKLERYSGWLESGALVVRFEELIGSAGGGDNAGQAATLTAIFEHIGLSTEGEMVARIGRRLFSSNSPTFRRGAIGSWRQQFDPDIAEAFDRSVGGYLATYGYGTTTPADD